MSKLRKQDLKFAYLACLPLLIYLFFVLFIPMGKGIYLSFTNKMIGGKANFIGLKNYLHVTRDKDFWHALVVTYSFTAITVFCKACLGLIMALVLNVNFKGKNTYRSLLLVPWTLPNVIVVLNWRWIFSDIGGVANHLLQLLGLADKNLVWFGSSALAFFCICFVNIWRGTPFFGISILSQLQSISEDYYEASEIDGANAWQQFRYITFPAIVGVMSLSALMSTIWTLNEFETVQLLTGGGPNRSTEVINVYSYRTAMSSMQLGKGITISIMSIPVLLILIFIISKQIFKEDKVL